MSGLSLESVLLEYGASEVSAMDVYSDIFQLGDGFREVFFYGGKRN